MTESSHPQLNEKVSSFWSDERKDLRAHNWLEHPTARQLINHRVSGNSQVAILDYWRKRFLPESVPLVLSLGCGFGAFERQAVSTGIAQRVEANDVSEGAIAQARLYAGEQGLADRITYSVIDLNTEDLPKNRYNAAFAISSVHHVFQLEAVFRRCSEALIPGGLFFLDEYIGPSRFQCSPAAVRMINRLLQSLPSKYRLSVYANNQPVEQYANPSISWFEMNDPSEAIRSAEILPVLKHYFDIVDLKPYGGSILHMLLSGTAGNFDPSSDSDVALLKTIATLEEALEECGVLQSDFAAIVARPRL